jgi:FkbM family methyltransferase
MQQADGNVVLAQGVGHPAPLPGIVARLQSYLVDGHAMRFGPLETVVSQIDGQRIIFHLNMERDPIQRCNRQGAFYEADDLAFVTTLLPPNPVVLDVGANIGNHALYFAIIAKAKQVIVIEPNPLAIEPLVANVLVNGLEDVISLHHIGFGLSDRAAGGYSMKVHDRNLGATQMKADGFGHLTVVSGDEAFPALMPDLIKIDVEGMELPVLHGLQRMIERARPVLMVEVTKTSHIDFALWAAKCGYATKAISPVGPKNDNHILVPA